MEKFLINGKKVWVEKTLDNGFLVYDILEYEDRELYDDSCIYFVEHVFDHAPTNVYDKRIDELKKRICDLENKKTDIITKLRAEEEKESAMAVKLKRREELSLLMNFIAGEITHYVEFGWEPRIIPFNDAKDEYGKRSLKLLTLFGNTDGSLTWKLNSYRDGSGNYVTVIPCRSFEESQAILQKYIDDKITGGAIDGKYIKLAEKYSLLIPDNYKEQVEKKIIAAHEMNIKKCEEQITQHRADINRIKSGSLSCE